MALAVGGALLVRGATRSGDAARAQLARYFAENHLGDTGALRRVVLEGGDSLLRAAGLLAAM